MALHNLTSRKNKFETSSSQGNKNGQHFCLRFYYYTLYCFTVVVVQKDLLRFFLGTYAAVIFILNYKNSWILLNLLSELTIHAYNIGSRRDAVTVINFLLNITFKM